MTNDSDTVTVTHDIIIPSDPKALQELKKVVEDISNQKTIIEGYQAIIKEGIDGAAEKFGIPKKYISKLVTTFHARNFNKTQKEAEDFATLYGKVIEEDI